MSPRSYRMTRRTELVQQNRANMVAAAKHVVRHGGMDGFTIEAVARQAKVSRVTVYYQFRSKQHLLEALFDDIAQGGGLDGIIAALQKDDPAEALKSYILGFAEFWSADPELVRRLEALASLDVEIATGMASRNERRRTRLLPVVKRYQARYGRSKHATADIVDAIHMLTSFATFDQLASRGRSAREVGRLIYAAAVALLQARSTA